MRKTALSSRLRFGSWGRGINRVMCSSVSSCRMLNMRLDDIAFLQKKKKARRLDLLIQYVCNQEDGWGGLTVIMGFVGQQDSIFLQMAQKPHFLPFAPSLPSLP